MSYMLKVPDAPDVHPWTDPANVEPTALDQSDLVQVEHIPSAILCVKG